MILHIKRILSLFIILFLGIIPQYAYADTADDLIKEIDRLTNNSDYGNCVMSKDGKEANIYLEESKKSEVIGIITNKSIANIDLTYYGDDDWFKVSANNEEIVGYVPKSQVITGDQLEEKCKSLKLKRTAVVNVVEIDIRAKHDVTSEIIDTAEEGESFILLKEYDDAVKVKLSKKKVGFITKDYIKKSYNFTKVRDILEEKRIAEEKAREEAARIAAENSFFNQNIDTDIVDTTSKNSLVDDSVYELSDLVNASVTRQSIVRTALSYVGNKYVWGGTSLTDGTDCSGFVLRIFEKFGYNLPRTSYQQRSYGTKITEDELLPGDIICYYGHVAIYVGNNYIVHASNSKPYPKGGIKVSKNYKYRKIASYRRIINE